MRIANNIMALNAHRQLMINQGGAAKSIEKLSSGLRINRAGDDAAGLAISEKMRGQIRGLNMAAKNAQDAISLIQTAEGALQETHSILQRMRELAVQAASDTNTNADRAEIQKEIDQLAQELSRISNNTEFNTMNLLGGNFNGTFHIGANEGQGLTLSIGPMDAFSLGVARDGIAYSGAAAGNIASAGLADASSVGPGIVDNARLTFHYTAGTSDAAAMLTGTGTAVPNTDLSSIDAELTITVDGVDVTLDSSALQAWGDGDSKNISDLVTFLQAALDNANVKATVSEDSGNLVIESGTVGLNSSVSIHITGSDASVIENWLGFSDGDNAVGTSAQDTVRISDGSTSQVVVIADPNADTLSITSGHFRGLTITMAEGSTLSNLDASNDSVTISQQTVTARAAVFDPNTGEMVEKAVAPAGIDVSTQAAADKAITVIQNAIDIVSAERSKLGAYQNRLEHTIANLGVSAENLQAAESRIRDVDMAQEMMNFTKYQILQQASTAMLAQANLAPQSVLQLLG